MRGIIYLTNITLNYNISHLDYNIMERLDRRLVKLIYNILQFLLYSNSVLNENYKYLMSKYKLSHIVWNLSLIHVFNKIKVPPLSENKSSV